MLRLCVYERTDLGMCAQFLALESTLAESPCVKTMLCVDTSRATGRTSGRTAGVQHDHGETPVGVGNQQERHPVSPEQYGGQGASRRGRGTLSCSMTAQVVVVDQLGADPGNPTVPCHHGGEPVRLASGRAGFRPALSVGCPVGRRGAPVPARRQALVWFYMQKMENPEVAAVEYPQGTLAGDEIREYLLGTWGRTCAYCGATDTMLNIDYNRPKAAGVSSRVSNPAVAGVLSYHSKVKANLTVWGATAFSERTDVWGLSRQREGAINVA